MTILPSEVIVRERYRFLEGLRGVAALQVLLLHYAALFLPIFARVAPANIGTWESTLGNSPLFFLVDGYTSVYLFFLISGFVLTPSFLSSSSYLSKQMFKRFLRLWIPVAVAVVIGALFLTISNEERLQALRILKSDWGVSLYRNPMHLADLARDLLLGSMLLGYSGISIFSAIPLLSAHLTPHSYSLVPPTWTLHVEFWGAMMLLAVAFAYKRLPRKIFVPFFLGAIWFTGTSCYSLFLVGFLAYIFRESIIGTSLIRLACSVCLIVAGICISSMFEADGLLGMIKLVQGWFWGHAPSPMVLKHEIVALLLFFGVIMSSQFRSVFSGQILVWLGKISFSVYLLHFPILFTFGAAIFVFVYPSYGYVAACLSTCLISGTATIAISVYFEKIIDRRAIALSRGLTTKD
jgi:peptidoglycan/LPS O-acetylase OafA/YrhL